MKKIALTALLFYSILPAMAILTPLVDSIPMSDGRKLAVDIYIPPGLTTGPVILIQTPYNRQMMRLSGLPLGIGMNLNSSNYIFVITDWRGFYGSLKAAYPGSPDRVADGYSTVEWIASRPWSNGKVGTWGPSALGKVQFQTAKRKPPHLTCICPSVAAPQFDYSEYYPNGALRTEYVEQLDGLGFGLTPFLMAHPFQDNTWSYSETFNHYPDSITVPCFMIGGWYDHNTQLMMDFFSELTLNSPINVRSKHKILMGPWVHGGHSTARVGTSSQGELSYPNAQNKNDTMALQFFDYYLRNMSNGWESNSVYSYYQMGQNTWQQSSVWPPSGISSVRFYLHDGFMLHDYPPTFSKDTFNYIYNPSDPSPTIGGSTLRSDLTQGPYDQRTKVESRSDHVDFTSNYLTQNVVLKGNVEVHLKVSSDRLDTDFDVRLTDVYPDGSSMLINDGVMRMRFRNGFTQAQTAMMVPGKIYNCVISLPITGITFLNGHRIRLIISSSNYPRFNRNMNTGGEMYPGKSMDSLYNPLQAINTIHFDATNTSFIDLPLMNYVSSINQKQPSTNRFYVYPNPAGNQLNVWMEENGNEESDLLIFNELGQNVMKIKLTAISNGLDISSLSQGVYTIRIGNNGFIQRLIKL